jgi:hypothetical protein
MEMAGEDHRQITSLRFARFRDGVVKRGEVVGAEIAGTAEGYRGKPCPYIAGRAKQRQEQALEVGASILSRQGADEMHAAFPE